jgi:hypothetical protein
MMGCDTQEPRDEKHNQQLPGTRRPLDRRPDGGEHKHVSQQMEWIKMNE